MFKPLTKDNVAGIVRLMLADVNKRLEERRIRIELSPAAMDFVAENGFDPVFGARPLKRFIQKEVETLAAKMILSDAVKDGDTITINVEDGKLYGEV